jgi:micrococcal nuclease
MATPSPLARSTSRILNIDAPKSFRSHCERERPTGLRAKERPVFLIRSGSSEVGRYGRDRYRRTLARVDAGGRDLGEVLVREWLALPWHAGREAIENRIRFWCG